MPILQHREQEAASPPSPALTIQASVSYLRATTETPINYLYDPPPGTPRENCSYEPRAVAIRDARPTIGRLSIDQGGFELHCAPTGVADFLDADQVSRVYYPEIAELARAITGGTYAYVFDHLVRMREPARPPMTFGRHTGAKYPSAAGRVHNDYTERSARRRLAMVLDNADDVAAVTRFCFVNLWRSITAYPVLDTPLGLCDARTVAPRDLVASEIHYPSRVGEIYVATHSDAHEWSYFSEMSRNEILVFKQYDSAAGVARFTPHAAFDHPDAPAGAPPRQSIEARCLVTYN